MAEDILNFGKIVFVVENNYEQKNILCETILHDLIANQFLDKIQRLQV